RFHLQQRVSVVSEEHIQTSVKLYEINSILTGRKKIGFRRSLFISPQLFEGYFPCGGPVSDSDGFTVAQATLQRNAHTRCQQLDNQILIGGKNPQRTVQLQQSLNTFIIFQHDGRKVEIFSLPLHQTRMHNLRVKSIRLLEIALKEIISSVLGFVSQNLQNLLVIALIVCYQFIEAGNDDFIPMCTLLLPSSVVSGQALWCKPALDFCSQLPG